MGCNCRIVEVARMMIEDRSFLISLTGGIFIGIGLLTTFLYAIDYSAIQKNKGYYEAYKQFKHNTIEQLAPNSIKLRYETELLQQKYKDK
jgi:hypothetical protein